VATILSSEQIKDVNIRLNFAQHFLLQQLFDITAVDEFNQNALITVISTRNDYRLLKLLLK
jgi:hypothetical protein